jgi:hypothetical protein
VGTLTVERYPAPLGTNPLEEAASWLRRAATVPYDSRDPVPWLEEFRACVAAARRALATSALESPGLPPRLLPSARRESEAHEGVTNLAAALFTDAYIAVEPDLLEMVDLAESAKALEHAINALRDRRSDLLFEATYQDIGGG